MKNIFIIIIIIIFVISLDFMTENYTNSIVDEINKKLEELNQDIENYYLKNKKNFDDNLNVNNNDVEYAINSQQREMESKKIEENANDILKLWREKEDILSWYIEHDEVEKVSDKINVFNKQIEIKEYYVALVSITEVDFLLGHITEKQNLCLKNIF